MNKREKILLTIVILLILTIIGGTVTALFLFNNNKDVDIKEEVKEEKEEIKEEKLDVKSDEIQLLMNQIVIENPCDNLLNYYEDKQIVLASNIDNDLKLVTAFNRLSRDRGEINTFTEEELTSTAKLIWGENIKLQHNSFLVISKAVYYEYNDGVYTKKDKLGSSCGGVLMSILLKQLTSAVKVGDRLIIEEVYMYLYANEDTNESYILKDYKVPPTEKEILTIISREESSEITGVINFDEVRSRAKTKWEIYSADISKYQSKLNKIQFIFEKEGDNYIFIRSKKIVNNGG